MSLIGNREHGIFKARGFHGATDQTVLVHIASSVESFGELERISEVLTRSGHADLGVVIDREAAPDDSWRALITTWHDGAVSLDTLLRETGAMARLSQHNVTILHILRGIAEQIQSLHDNGFAHRDISLANILVGSDGKGHLIDFETAGPVLPASARSEATWTFTPSYASNARNQAIASMDYTPEDEFRWDRFAFGKLVQSVRATADPYLFSELTFFNQRGLQLMAGLLMGRDILPGEAALGLPVDFFKDEEYQSLRPFIEATSRLLGDDSSILPELSSVQRSVIEIGAVQPAPFSDRVRALVDTSRMQALGSFQQLGLISFIWPSATHTRMEHAIGTFATACEALRNMLEDPQSPIVRVMSTQYVQSTYLAAALLHDVGHFPLAHDLEEALPTAFHHESRSVEFIETGEISLLLEKTPFSVHDKRRANGSPDIGWGVRAADVASIIEGAPRPGGQLSSWIVTLLHSMLSGAIDVDKIDYLVRDSQRLHVAAGAGIDVPRVLSSLTVALVELPGRSTTRRSDGEVGLRLAVRAKGARPAELVGRIRSHMFGVVYWHHSYRAIKAMMHWICWEAVASVPTIERVRRKSAALSKSLNNALGENESSMLFESSLMLPGFERMWEEAPKIPAREASVLHFLAEQGGETSTELLRLLENRRWYRPLLTIHHPENLAATDADDEVSKLLWGAVERLQRVPSERWLLTRMQWARNMQDRVLTALYAARPPVTAIVRRGELLDQIARRSNQQLLLIDTVEARKSREKPLYIMQGERRSSRHESTSAPIPVRQSYDQHMLSREFVVANGAIRVLAHPDFVDLIERTLSSDSLSEMLVDSLPPLP